MTGRGVSVTGKVDVSAAWSASGGSATSLQCDSLSIESSIAVQASVGATELSRAKLTSTDGSDPWEDVVLSAVSIVLLDISSKEADGLASIPLVWPWLLSVSCVALVVLLSISILFFLW